jgi:hypothetical protein
VREKVTQDVIIELEESVLNDIERDVAPAIYAQVGNALNAKIVTHKAPLGVPGQPFFPLFYNANGKEVGRVTAMVDKGVSFRDRMHRFVLTIESEGATS